MGLLLMLASAAMGQEAITLPGGASALTETHGDWIVRCEARLQQIGCALAQEQLDASTRQRILAIELLPRDSLLQGSLVLPFGLALEQGVRLQVDEGAPLPTLPFRTCLPVGCIVDLAFRNDVIVLLSSGTTLKINATADGGGNAPFSVPLAGFSGALERTIALSQL